MKFDIRRYLFGIIIFVLGAAATLMLFLPGLIDVNAEVTYTGSQVVFGSQLVDLGVLGTVQIEPSALGIIAFLLPALAGLIAIFTRKGAFVSAAMFIAAAIMLFLIPTYTQTSITLLGNTSVYETTWSMGGGLIAAAVLSIIGAVVSLYVFLISLKSERQV
ncbi:MAG: hypothetical protein WC282_04400 [Bacilli bacterium]|jgi:hypothetical protein